MKSCVGLSAIWSYQTFHWVGAMCAGQSLPYGIPECFPYLPRQDASNSLWKQASSTWQELLVSSMVTVKTVHRDPNRHLVLFMPNKLYCTLFGQISNSVHFISWLLPLSSPNRQVRYLPAIASRKLHISESQSLGPL